MRKAHAQVLAAVAAVVGGSLFSSAVSAQIVIDGTRDANYGSPLAVQTVNTGFGNNQSELDAMYSSIVSGKLNLMFAGNLESNFNKLVVFLDTKTGGQNTIRQDSPIQDNYTGIKFDAGFSPDYSMIINRGGGNLYVDFSELPTNGGGFGGYAGRISLPDNVPADQQIGSGTLIEGANGMPSILVGYNDANVGGVVGDVVIDEVTVKGAAADQTAAAAVTTGFEFSMDLSALGITGDFRVMAFVNGSGHDFASNQFLPGLPAPQANLGNNGSGGLSNVDLTAFAGDQFVTIPYAAAANSWNLATGGSWSVASNWSGGVVPNGANAQAKLSGPAGAGTRAITLDTDITVQQITFDNATASYDITTPGTLTISSNPLLAGLVVVAGNHTISAPVTVQNAFRVDVAAGSSLALTGTVSAAGQNLFVGGGGTFSMPAGSLNSITVNAGTLKNTGTTNAVVKGVTVDTGATLDLTNSVLIVDYDEGFSPFDTIKAYVASGQLTSSTVITSDSRTIGYLDSAAIPELIAFGDTSLDVHALVFRATLKGDTNLDRTVGFEDLLALAQNYNQPGTKFWSHGDSNYDNTVEFADLLALAQNYNSTLSLVDASSIGSSTFASDFALAISLTPEPATLSALVGGAMLIGRRRRK